VKEAPDMNLPRTISAGLSAAAAVLLLIGCGGGGDKKDTGGGTGDGKNGPGKKEVGKPDITTTAEQLAKEFLADQKAAEAKYKDKVIEISGPVTQLIFEGDKAVVNLKGAKKDEKDIPGVSFNCALQGGYRDAGARLGKDQKVQVVGKYHMTFASVVQLYDCTIKELEPSKTLQVTAEALAEEFQKDAKAAHEKYKDQWVLITGEVLDLPSRDGFYFAKLKGKDPVSIRVTLAGSEQKSLQKSQTVTLHGEGTFPELQKNEVGFDAGFIVSRK
jgi:hypothetical protein